MPLLPWLIVTTSLVTPLPKSSDTKVFDFAQANAKAWRSVNDGVMGGRSSGQSKINGDKKLEFYGTLSLANNGGFASIRTTGSNLRMSSGDAVVLRVKGDGREYSFNVYAQANLGGYSFRQKFKTKKGQWIEVRLAVDDFRATWRGRTYSRVKLDPQEIKGMGILLGDKKPGPFKLEIDWIKVVSP